MKQLDHSRDLAYRLLAEPLPRRWSHTQGVGQKAESVAHLLGDDAEILIRAAWLHDVGYAPESVNTGLHQLDGARYLRDVANEDARVCQLVAYHSCAVIEARHRGLASELEAEFAPIGGLIANALTYADMTTSPDGDPVRVEDRLTEILSRYGDGDVVAQSIREARFPIVASVQAVTRMLAPGERTG